MQTSLDEHSSLEHFGDAVRRDSIALPDVTAVLAYLHEHNGLESLVQRLCHHVRDEFGTEATLSLEVYCDPEVEESYLILYVRPATYDLTLMRGIEAVRQAYAEQLASAPGWFHLTTDFRAAQ